MAAIIGSVSQFIADWLSRAPNAGHLAAATTIVRVMSALLPKADVGTQSWNVRFVPKADILHCGRNWHLFDNLVGGGKQRRAILAVTTPVLAALVDETRTVPIVFVRVSDPLGFVDSVAKPSGNVTGFTNFQPSLAGKWIQLLKEIAPAIVRVTIMFNPATTPNSGLDFLRAAEAAGPSAGVQVSAARINDAADIEPVIAAVAREGNGGLVNLPDVFLVVHRQLTIELAARYRVPMLYQYRYFVTSGGLISYGIDVLDQYIKAAGYMDRILKGAKLSDLPVQPH